jgi:hypothetical protein
MCFETLLLRTADRQGRWARDRRDQRAVEGEPPAPSISVVRLVLFEVADFPPLLKCLLGIKRRAEARAAGHRSGDARLSMSLTAFTQACRFSSWPTADSRVFFRN